MTVDLSTTNLLLGIMAVVSLLEAIVVVGVGVAGFMAYRRVMTMLEGLENRQVAPAMARVNSILDDVKGVTTTVKKETNRVDQAIYTTIGRIDNTADRVRAKVRVKTSRLVGVIRGARVAIDTFLNHDERAGNGRQATSNM